MVAWEGIVTWARGQRSKTWNIFSITSLTKIMAEGALLSHRRPRRYNTLFCTARKQLMTSQTTTIRYRPARLHACRATNPEAPNLYVLRIRMQKRIWTTSIRVCPAPPARLCCRRETAHMNSCLFRIFSLLLACRTGTHFVLVIKRCDVSASVRPRALYFVRPFLSLSHT